MNSTAILTRKPCLSATRSEQSLNLGLGKKSGFVIAFCIGGFALSVLCAPAKAQNLVLNGTFESDLTTAYPPTEDGASPHGWRVNNHGKHASGLRTACVVKGGAAFSGGGSKSLLFVDSDGVEERLSAHVAFEAPYQEQAPMMVRFDFKINQRMPGPDLLVFRVAGASSAGSGINVAGLKLIHGSKDGQVLLQRVAGGPPLQALNIGEWYRMEMKLPPPGSPVETEYTVKMTNEATQATAEHVFQTEQQTDDYRSLSFTAGFGPDGQSDMQFDNVEVLPAP